MKLTLEQIKSITNGVEDICYENGKFVFYRFSKNEEEVIDNPNLFYTAGVQMKFKTDSKRLKLKVNTSQTSGIRSYFAFDVFENDILIGGIQNFEDNLTGDYANKEYKLGEYECDLALSAGENSIRIVFPHSVIAEIIEIELVDASFILPLKYEKSIIFYGDSITQGYDVLHPSKSYANLLGDYLNANLINKALGGAQFLPKLVGISNCYNPDCVIVAYGTNDWNICSKQEIENNISVFLENVTTNYPYSKIFVISPIWRKDYKENKKFGTFFELDSLIEKLCSNRENILFISGFSLVPQEEIYFGDLKLHPNDIGFQYFYKNLVDIMKVFFV